MCSQLLCWWWLEENTGDKAIYTKHTSRQLTQWSFPVDKHSYVYISPEMHCVYPWGLTNVFNAFLCWEHACMWSPWMLAGNLLFWYLLVWVLHIFTNYFHCPFEFEHESLLLSLGILWILKDRFRFSVLRFSMESGNFYSDQNPFPGT